MAVEIGTATNFDDLYSKLVTFLSTNATLVAAGQEWDVVTTESAGTSGTTTLLKGPGTAGADEILVALFPNKNVGGDIYNLGISGLSSYNPALSISAQPGFLASRWLHLTNASMPYWFIANGRRFIVVVRASTVYESAYAGYILPYHLPTVWAYPMYIGACSANSAWRYSEVNGGHSAFFNPGSSTASETLANASAAIRLPDGQWQWLANKAQSSSEVGVNTNNVAPWGFYFFVNRREGVDGNYKPIPAEIAITVPYNANLGALQGVYYIPGFGTSAENTFVADGVTHLVIQNVHRNSNNEFAAIALE